MCNNSIIIGLEKQPAEENKSASQPAEGSGSESHSQMSSDISERKAKRLPHRFTPPLIPEKKDNAVDKLGFSKFDLNCSLEKRICRAANGRCCHQKHFPD